VAPTLTERSRPTPGEDRRLLGHSEISFGPRHRPVIAGVLAPDTVRSLEPDAAVVELLPHDALAVLERTDPDLILIETAAFEAGRPWAFAGDPSAADRARRLGQILDLASALERPSVLSWSSPVGPSAGMLAFQPRFDLVVRPEIGPDEPTVLPWSPGVQLARFHPIGVDPARPMRPVSCGGWDRSAPLAIRTFAQEALPAGAAGGLEIWVDTDDAAGRAAFPEPIRDRVVGRLDGRFAAETYRSNGLFLAAPLSARPGSRSVAPPTLAQLACGARLIVGPGHPAGEAFGDVVVRLDRAADLPAAIDEARSRGPLSESETRDVIRRLFFGWSSETAIADLLRYLGLDWRRPSARDVCAVAWLPDRRTAARFVDDALRQRHRPVLAVVAGDEAGTVANAVAELERAGIRATPQVGPRDDGLLRWAADRTTAGWLWVWAVPTAQFDPSFLLDAVVAGRATSADVVGAAAGRTGFVTDLPVAGSIVSRETVGRLPLLDGASLDPWVRRGARLYAVASEIEPGR
jgi:hypothetical protein